MERLTKTQKIATLAVVIVAILFLVLGCGTAVNSEVKTDSTLNDSVLVDSIKVDTIGKD